MARKQDAADRRSERTVSASAAVVCELTQHGGAGGHVSLGEQAMRLYNNKFCNHKRRIRVDGMKGRNKAHGMRTTFIIFASVAFFLAMVLILQTASATAPKPKLVFVMQQNVSNASTYFSYRFTNETWRAQSYCQQCLERGVEFNFTNMSFFYSNGTQIFGCPLNESIITVAAARPLASCINASGNYTVHGYASR